MSIHTHTHIFPRRSVREYVEPMRGFSASQALSATSVCGLKLHTHTRAETCAKARFPDFAGIYVYIGIYRNN